MAIITEEELKRRLEHESNLLNILGITVPSNSQPAEIQHKKIHNGGRRPGDTNIPQEIREAAGAMAHLDTAANVAELFGISPIQVHHLKHGRRAHNIEDDSLKMTIASRLESVRETAVDRMIESLSIVETGLKKVSKATTASKIARDMSAIIEKTSDKRPEAQNVTFQIYAPQVRQEKSFEVIEVERVVE